MAFTYADIISDARVDLKDTAGGTYKAAPMLKWANDAVQIARKVLARLNPEMIQSSKAINLTTVLGSGPYVITSDFEQPMKLLDEYSREIDSSYRGEFDVSNRSGKPDGYWIEGHDPAQIFVNSTPNQAYAWTLYYIATVARATDAATSIALPDFLREKLVAWLVKFAGANKEFDTSSEDEQIAVMEKLLADILIKRRSKIVLNISGVGF